MTATLSDVATLPGRLLQLAEERPNDPAMREKHRGIWREWTWATYADRVASVAIGLKALGVEPGDRVAIHAENRPEWVVADLAIQGIGAQCIGVYPTSPAAEVEYLLSHSGATVLIAEDEEQFDKVAQVRDRLPALRHIVLVDPQGIRVEDHRDVHTFSELENHGDARAEFAREVSSVDPEATAILVYTSGTTGPPKGAMISHANLVASGRCFIEALGATSEDEVLSYLPLCHIAERLISVIDAVWAGLVVNFGEGGPAFQHDLRDVQPTVFLGVPRVWEKMLAGVEIRMADASRLKRGLYQLCLRQGRRIAPRRMAESTTFADRVVLALCELLVFRALREKLGMSRVRAAISGAAPIAPQVLEFLWAIGIPVREGYGQTENTAICTLTPVGDVRLGAVGTTLPGVEIRIADDGEILTRSAGVFQGYLDNPEATAETVDAEGWLHTGDVGEVDDDGFLRITDRKKDIIITAGGKNISPSEIENLLKVSPFVREAIVIGDRRKFLSALIGVERDTVGNWATRRGITYTTYADLSAKPEIEALIAKVVDEANASLANVEKIKRFKVITKELDHEDGELTATQKVKRRAVEQRFAEEIEAMYT
ncbi:long-chain acyl-CoA synthetase [Actinokineospora alba]|uniref:Acyl-CoA synthetase n=1 Tax=Actinokineospora alba TaxID=504798 RepID=A0A1H0IAS3_9PSEU|nr:AMP-binding protein [Actinokineospora alba]TDP71018.1 long-chain acyl-CoA synthetase [Actinokineospora alba]SDI87826.1 long-chain acyl-CoA synthetase [Actinokineospora alba]SDO28465.1 long-chain acyl-CoA synthetase [Actinokineospora alba]